ncbi:MAG TPA: GNAT family N-acetyltransferase [Gammaproteobacteria bacterium]|nr:GNAT family N-acetyltransferase [Gammaproteobacteria bacterium]
MTDGTAVAIAGSDGAIQACFPVMVQLRPHLRAEEFVPRVRRQMDAGFRLVALSEGGAVKAVAGFRLSENLVFGRFMYVDDLVTDAHSRSAGHGRVLFDWLVRHARENGCSHLELDSGVQRFDAHRFYLRQRMVLRSHHFSLKL